MIAAGADILLISGGMSVDPDDVTPQGIAMAGADIEVYGAPVLPGAMFMLAYRGEVPVIGVPACGMFFGRPCSTWCCRGYWWVRDCAAGRSWLCQRRTVPPLSGLPVPALQLRPGGQVTVGRGWQVRLAALRRAIWPMIWYNAAIGEAATPDSLFTYPKWRQADGVHQVAWLG